jgi:hypothetical protein
MKRFVINFGGILFIVIFIFQCNGNIPIMKNNIAGMYINKNYEKKICCVESPHKPDSLILKPDGTLSSNFFGTGTYKINYGILETEIELHYENKNGKAGHYTYFVNRLFENPKIIMNSDTNHYFEKTEQNN